MRRKNKSPNYTNRRVSKEHYRRKDLIAQRVMAFMAKKSIRIGNSQLRWVRWEVILLGATIFIGSIGICLAYRANKAAMESVYIDARPWLSVDMQIESYMDFRQLGKTRLQVRYHNYGKTPAVDAVTRMKWFPHADSFPESNLVAVIGGMCGQEQVDDLVHVVFPEGDLTFRKSTYFDFNELQKFVDSDVRPHVTLIGCTTYIAPVSEDTHDVEFAYRLRFFEDGNCDTTHPDVMDDYPHGQRLTRDEYVAAEKIYLPTQGSFQKDQICLRSLSELTLGRN